MPITRLTLLLLAATVTAVGAQTPSVAVRPAEPDVSSPVLGGVVLGLGGFVLGAAVGSRSSSNCSEDGCLGPTFAGAAIGGTFGMALGVHLGNRSRGSLGLDFLAGAGVWAGGMLIGSATHWRGRAPTFILVGIPIVQMIATISVEQHVGRSRDRDPGSHPSMSFMPTDGGGTMAITVPLPRIP